jgi:hypothetical protein
MVASEIRDGRFLGELLFHLAGRRWDLNQALRKFFSVGIAPADWRNPTFDAGKPQITFPGSHGRSLQNVAIFAPFSGKSGGSDVFGAVSRYSRALFLLEQPPQSCQLNF